MPDSISSNATPRELPGVNELIRLQELSDLGDSVPPKQLTNWARAAIESIRLRLLAGEAIRADDLNRLLVDRVRSSARDSCGETIRHVINATGVLLHTNLGRAPLAESVAKRIQSATAYCNVELNLETGRRSKRGASVAAALADLTGAEDAVVVNNCAAATILVLHAVAAGREVIISRGQLVEIGGGFRLPDVFHAAGVTLREVGTTNRTYLRDYENAITDKTGAIIRVHRGNFEQTGFVTQPSLKELLECDRSDEIPVIDDVGSGNLFDREELEVDEPDVRQSVSAGSDLVLFSGDKLFGGPQCGIVVGKKRWIDVLRKSPMMRAMRIDKITLAALQATVEIHLSGNVWEELPFLRMLARDSESLRGDCESLLSRLEKAIPPGRFSLSVVPCQSQIGGGSMPGVRLDSVALSISGEGLDDLAAKLRAGDPAIQPRLSDGQLLLDLRTVLPGEHTALVDQLSRALKETSNAGLDTGTDS